MAMDRRGFLAGAALLAACGTDGQAPVAPATSVRAPRRGDALPGSLDQRILVLVELQGGNDGLNTVIPVSQPAYRWLRPGLAIDPARALGLDADHALHPALEPLLEAWDAGECAIVESVGYPRPNRSHFRSIEIWEQATASDAYASEGWATRALREHPSPSLRAGADADGIVVGTGAIGPLAGAGVRVVNMRDPRQFLAQSERLRALGAPAEGPEALRHLLRTQNEAAAAAQAVQRKLSGRERFARRFSWDPLARGLAHASDMIADGVRAPVWKVTLAGFDTHADQAQRHERLLGQVAGALATFRAAMREMGRWNDTLVLTYSEFGRRAGENLSRGTDHGTAAPLFALGGAVEGGLRGTLPDLEALEDGDPRAQVDFRAVYAGAIAGLWEQPSNFLAAQGHAPVQLLRRRA
jgi:uncharacterized protein (DUF1501 family)